MASGWSTVRDEIRAVLEGNPYNLRRVKQGVADLAGLVESGAGAGLFHDGYFMSPVSMEVGPYMQLLSTERAFQFEIYTGITVGSDFDTSLDELQERVEQLVQDFHNCNANVPSAKILSLYAPIVFSTMPDEPTNLYAVMPYRCIYRM